MTLSTHVLDTSIGMPAVGLPLAVERLGADGGWVRVSERRTDSDGRVADAVPSSAWARGRWRLVLDTSTHLGAHAFFPEVTVVFTVTDPARHLHVPVLLSPFGVTIYRSS